jgi:hypothetical protein
MSLASLQANLLGTRLTLWLGMTVAAPAPAPIVEALHSVEVSLSDQGRDAFTLTFTVGRSGLAALDYFLVANPLLKPFNRVIIQVWEGFIPQTLIDGFITKSQLRPGDQPGSSTFTVNGEDMRVLMDLHEISMPYPNQPPEVRVAQILARYATYLGAPPLVIPSPTPDIPLMLERIPVQNSTDLNYVNECASDNAYVFYVEPTPVPMVNVAYWGPPQFAGEMQSALSINMGPETNATINFDYDAMTPTVVFGAIQDKKTKAIIPVVTATSLRPPLTPIPSLIAQLPYVRTQMAKDSGSLDPVQAFARAQAVTDDGSLPVTADGELDMARYGAVLRPRRLVGVRGAGFAFDGFYYVQRVTHRIQHGDYKQSFTLKRDGFGAISPVIMV